MKWFFPAFTILFLFPVFGLKAQLPADKMTKEAYIKLYKDIAIKEMNTYGIPSSITLAQGILESANGNSTLAKKANNHFGIKCHEDWNGPSFHMDDDLEDECFRKYSDPFESFKDHSVFLATRDRYASLFNLEITDYKGWAKGLKEAGYATNPKYPQLLINIIEEFELFQYDRFYDAEQVKRNRELALKNNSKSYPELTVAEESFVKVTDTKRKIFSNKGIKFIYAEKEDNPEKIAKDLKIYTWQVYKYNDLKKRYPITEGQVIYVEAKKNKGDKPFHIVVPGQTLRDISQIYAVKLKKLCKYNTLRKDATLYPDQKIKLRK